MFKVTGFSTRLVIAPCPPQRSVGGRRNDVVICLRLLTPNAIVLFSTKARHRERMCGDLFAINYSQNYLDVVFHCQQITTGCALPPTFHCGGHGVMTG